MTTEVVPFRQRLAQLFRVSQPQPLQPRAPSSLFVEQATDDFLKWVTTVAEPDEVLKKAGVQRPMLRAITGDDDITAAMDTRIEALLSTEYRFEPQPDTPEEPMAFIAEQFAPHAEKFLRACMAALPYGYSVQEAVYVISEDRVCIKEITEKPFEWFVPRLDGTVLWKSIRQPFGEVTDPRKYFLTARHQTYRNPYGEALFSRLYWPWLFRTNGWKFWVKWLERFGNPFLVGMTAGNAALMSAALADAAQAATVSVGAGDKVEVVQAQGSGEQFERFENKVVGRYQRLILGQTLTSDAGGSGGDSGSYALGKVHNEVRIDRRNADCRMCAETGQKLVAVLWELNSFPGSPPKFVIQDGTGLEEERANRDATLVSKTGLKLTPEYFLRVYDFEEEDIDVEAMEAQREAAVALADSTAANPEGVVVDQKQGPNAKGSPSQQGKNKPAAKAPARRMDTEGMMFAARRFTPSQQEIEDAIDAVLPNVQSPIPSEAIKDAIRSASSPDDLARKLAALFEGRSVGEFRDALANAMYVADVMGYASAERK
jgi:phage gp29-like protein